MATPDTLSEFSGEPKLSAEQIAAAPLFGRGKPAEHPFAALYQGEYETIWDGTAIAVRKHARALSAAGVPTVLRSFSNVVVNADGMPEPVHVVGIPLEVKAEVGAIHNTEATVMTPLIKHLVVRSAEHLRSVIYPRGIEHANINALQALRKAVADATILYTVWERDRVDPAIVKLLNRVAQIWVPCEQNSAMLTRSGVDLGRVMVVPHPYDDSDPLLKLRRRQPYPERRFYSIGRWEPRKGYHELLGAFLRTFRPGEAAYLTIKYGGGQWQGYPTPVESARHWGADPAALANGWTAESFREHVKLIGGRLSDSQILKLHFDHNIYVSASHGEAYCLPAFAAVLAGNQLVHCGYGGTADFAPPGSREIPFRLEAAVPESYKWEPGAQWAVYDENDLALALGSADAVSSYSLPDGFRERFGSEAVGKLMRDLAISVVEKTTPAAAEYYRCRTSR